MTDRNSVPLAARSVSTAQGGRLVIVGAGEWAAVAFERFCRDSRTRWLRSAPRRGISVLTAAAACRSFRSQTSP